MPDQISTRRKVLFYGGGLLMVVGIGSFMFHIGWGMLGGGENPEFEERMPAVMLTSMAIAMVGGFLNVIGGKGLAGSGLILDPDRARKDLKPYSKMAGGMLEDALENRDLSQSVSPGETIKIRCRPCGWLNDEESNFCHECGKPI